MLLEKDTVVLRVTEDNVSAFLACLAMGTLCAIRAKTLPAEAGIWTLGVPRIWEPLIASRAASSEVVEILQTFDELSAIQKLMPEKFDKEIDTLIGRLQVELANIEKPVWQMEWLVSQDGKLEIMRD